MIEINKDILVQIFGEKNKKVNFNSGKCGGCRGNGCCSSKNNTCKGCNSAAGGGCGHGTNCDSSIQLTMMDMYRNLQRFIANSSISQNVKLEFIDISDYENWGDKYPRIKELIDNGYEVPFTVIDGVIRYYGNISNVLIYKDVIELLE
ncbi:hypothetical protein [Clostridium sp. JN-1]|jgi:disulfide oxidoreductase YuzD|uniref:hypothetical protein n=1 Tax=Clostridium sp. JN-1 TaxID=2483110 RepID=UPI000F0BA3CB|nr:hypothetical protein [Clostridium sp. JN-1]